MPKGRGFPRILMTEELLRTILKITEPEAAALKKFHGSVFFAIEHADFETIWEALPPIDQRVPIGGLGARTVGAKIGDSTIVLVERPKEPKA